nr:hypothetical protein [Tanacetum cinerariifolium]
MGTRSSPRNLFPPLNNPELTIRRRSRSDPTLLNNSKIAAEGPGDLPDPDLRTIEELCQPSLNGRGATVSKTQNVYATGAYQAYQALAYQALVYQAPVHQPQIPQPQVVTTNDFTNFMKENDGILKNMQTNMTSLTNSNLEIKNMFGQFMKMNTASSSSLGTLLGNTITNSKEDLKGITTHSGTPYNGPTIPTTSSPPVAKRETKATKDSDFLLEEVDAFLALEDNPTLPEVDQPYVDTEGDILLLEAFLNDDLSLPPPN